MSPTSTLMPTTSICIPTYNGEQYIHECLDSVLTQSISDFEILVVDDCSSDSTFDIAQEYERKDPRVRTIRNQHNLGLVGNWNRCIELAQGEWIKFVFQDDIIDCECLEKMLAVADKDHPFICCRRDFIFDGVTKETENNYRSLLRTQSIDNLFQGRTEIRGEALVSTILYMGLNTPINFLGEPTSMLLHRAVFSKFGKFNPLLKQICDLEFWLRVGINTGLRYVPETLAHFRVHAGATTAKNRDRDKLGLEELDRLVLLHEFAYNPHYVKLRSTDLDNNKTATKWKVAKRARWISNQIRNRSAAEIVGSNDPLLDNWNNLLAAYPNLNSSFYARILKLLDQLNNHILWRFKH
mgnify:CR=1 FL=1